MKNKPFITVIAAAAVAVALTACSNPYTPPADENLPAPTASASPSAPDASPEPAGGNSDSEAPTEGTGVEDASYRAGTWADVTVSDWEVPAEAVEFWGEDETRNAGSLGLNYLTDFWGNSEVANGSTDRSAAQAAGYESYLTPDAWQRLNTALDSGNENEAQAALVTSLMPQAQFDNFISYKGETVIAERAPMGEQFQANGSWLSVTENEAGEPMLVLSVDTSITYTGTAHDGSDASITERREQWVNLVPGGEFGWLIADWGHNAISVEVG